MNLMMLKDAVECAYSSKELLGGELDGGRCAVLDPGDHGKSAAVHVADVVALTVMLARPSCIVSRRALEKTRRGSCSGGGR